MLYAFYGQLFAITDQHEASSLSPSVSICAGQARAHNTHSQKHIIVFTVLHSFLNILFLYLWYDHHSQ